MHEMKDRGKWIQTFGGRQFYPLAPLADEVDIYDIAHALSNLCRFCGHTRSFYSVAQHSVIVSLHVDQEIALEALMHDAAEAYTGDLVTPIKRQIKEWEPMEQRLMDVICQRFKINPEIVRSPAVVHADLVVLANEKRDVMGKSPAEWMPLPDPSPYIIVPQEPAQACESFIQRFNQLMATRIR